MLLILTLILNAIILATLRIPSNGGLLLFTSELITPVHLALTVGGIFHVLLSAWTLLEYFVINGANFVFPVFLYKIQGRLQRLGHYKHLKFMLRFVT